MRERAGKLIGKAREAVPEGTFAVGAGLAVAAITAYAFVIVAIGALGPSGDSAFGAFWGFIFVAGPGLFLPLEQEVGRALAHRRAQGIGGGPLVRRAASLGSILLVVMVLIVLAAAPLYVDGPFHGEWLLVVALAVGLVGFYCVHLTRGVLSGNARFRAYGEMMASEAIVRLVGALVLLAAGVENVGAYAMCLAVAPFIAVPFSLRHERGLLAAGPPAPYSELSNALGWLLLGSIFMQLLGYAALLGVNILRTNSPTQKEQAAAFTSAFFVARIPILLFQAVQGTLLPKLANLAGAGRHDDFRTGLKQLLLIVTGIATLGTVLAFTIGPTVGKILFNPFTISNVDLGLLAAGSGVFIIALTFAQALIALNGHARVAIAWVLGVAGFVLGTAFIPELELRVEIGFLVGSLVALVVIVTGLRTRMRRGVPDTLGPLIDAIGHEPLEI